MGDWQPIETAPKNGESVLIFRPYALPKGTHDINISYWYDTFWVIDHGPRLYESTHQQPTHWMPLPEAP